MNLFVFVVNCVFTNLFVRVIGKFYIQFRVDRPKTLIRRIIGNDYWDQPQWRTYACSNYTSTNNDSLPAEIWIGCDHAANLPYINKTKDMLDFSKNKTNGWLNIVKDKHLQEDLIEYLAAPDMSWASGNPNITASYIKAYVTYLSEVILFYDSYMIEKDLKFNISDIPLDWRGPAWLDWELFKPAKKAYNLYKKAIDKMHEMWLMNPETEGLLRKMIPVLTSKAMDPCFLKGVLSSFPEGSGMESYQYQGNPKDFLCTLYCRFSHVVSRLYRNAGSDQICALTGRGGRQNGGICNNADLCICHFVQRTKGKIVGMKFATSFSYCINVFNLRRYNETHSCSPDPT